MSTYRVTARRAGDWWALVVPDLPGVFSQAKRLEQADDAAREAIALMLEVEPEDVKVKVEPDLSPAEAAVLSELQSAQEAARKANEHERQMTQKAADVLTRQLSQRDAGRILGLSFQRVSQLVSRTPKGKRDAPDRQSRSGKISA